MTYSVNAPGGNVMPAEIWGGVEFGGMVGGGRQKTFGISSAPAMFYVCCRVAFSGIENRT